MVYIGAVDQDQRIKQVLSNLKKSGVTKQDITQELARSGLSRGDQGYAQRMWITSSQYGIRQPENFSGKAQSNVEVKYYTDKKPVYGIADREVKTPAGSVAAKSGTTEVKYFVGDTPVYGSIKEQSRVPINATPASANIRSSTQSEIRRQILESKEVKEYKEAEVKRILDNQKILSQNKKIYEQNKEVEYIGNVISSNENKPKGKYISTEKEATKYFEKQEAPIRSKIFQPIEEKIESFELKTKGKSYQPIAEFGVGVATGFTGIGKMIAYPIKTIKSTINIIKNPYDVGYSIGSKLESESPFKLAGEITATVITGKLISKAVKEIQIKRIKAQTPELAGVQSAEVKRIISPNNEVYLEQQKVAALYKTRPLIKAKTYGVKVEGYVVGKKVTDTSFATKGKFLAETKQFSKYVESKGLTSEIKTSGLQIVKDTKTSGLTAVKIQTQKLPVIKSIIGSQAERSKLGIFEIDKVITQEISQTGQIRKFGAGVSFKTAELGNVQYFNYKGIFTGGKKISEAALKTAQESVIKSQSYSGGLPSLYNPSLSKLPTIQVQPSLMVGSDIVKQAALQNVNFNIPFVPYVSNIKSDYGTTNIPTYEYGQEQKLISPIKQIDYSKYKVDQRNISDIRQALLVSTDSLQKTRQYSELLPKLATKQATNTLTVSTPKTAFASPGFNLPIVTPIIPFDIRVGLFEDITQKKKKKKKIIKVRSLNLPKRRTPTLRAVSFGLKQRKKKTRFGFFSGLEGRGI